MGNFLTQPKQYIRIASADQIIRVSPTSITVNYDDAIKEISVQKASAISAAYAYSTDFSVIHFGLICQNEFTVNGSVFPVMLVHSLPKDNKAAVRIEFVSTIDEAKQTLQAVCRNGPCVVSQPRKNVSSFHKIIPLLKDVLGHDFTWQPWEKGYSPQEFAESDDINCKRFINKVEKHLNYEIPTEFEDNAMKLLKQAASNNAAIKKYTDQLPKKNPNAACLVM